LFVNPGKDPDMKFLRSNQGGFTLVELLVAITILAVGLLSIAGMQIVAIKTNMSSSSLSAGSALAGGVLEEFMARDAGDAILRTAVPVASPATLWTGRVVEGGGTFQAAYSLETNTPVANVARITVTVTGGSDQNNVTRTAVVRGLKRYVP
jgi:type IV pilus assembly protein PilV